MMAVGAALILPAIVVLEDDLLFQEDHKYGDMWYI